MNKNFFSRENFINYIDEKDKLFEGEKNYFSVVWESCLTSDYWKSWKERIMTLPSEEVGFFEDRVLELRSRILWIVRSYRKNEWNDGYTRELVGINERELENVTEKEFYNNKSKNGVRKLTVEEISNMLGTFGSEQQGIGQLGNITENNRRLVDNSNPQNSEKNNSSNNFPTGWFVGGGILVITGLVLLFVIRNKKRIKKKLSH